MDFIHFGSVGFFRGGNDLFRSFRSLCTNFCLLRTEHSSISSILTDEISRLDTIVLARYSQSCASVYNGEPCWPLAAFFCWVIQIFSDNI